MDTNLKDHMILLTEIREKLERRKYFLKMKCFITKTINCTIAINTTLFLITKQMRKMPTG